MGLITLKLDVAGKGLLRLVIELGIVFAASVLVFAWKRALGTAAEDAVLNDVIQRLLRLYSRIQVALTDASPCGRSGFVLPIDVEKTSS